ncbi:MAG: hypothetical protein K1X82_06730, partial [Bacteroidia bacterium]|nr:hypothetical protein [Bacteroidia bacterium]
IALMLVVTGITYSNHFNNPFNFDDAHTIVTNQWIRNVKNIPQFFKDASTTSSLPANQAYRPGLTTLNAIDYWLSGGKGEPTPFMFHMSIFSSFLLLGLLLVLFFLKIFDTVSPNSSNKYFAVFGASFFLLHAANAETINYIIARSDSFSTLMIILALVLFQYSTFSRTYYLFLIPVIIGFFVKEPAIMVGPLLLLYIIEFEWDGSMKNLPFKSILVRVLPAIVLGIGLFLFAKANTPTTWTSGGGDRLQYLQTQTFVLVHYLNNFILPLNLSADTDWVLIKNPADDRVLIGVLVIIAALVLAWKTWKSADWRPVSFGILWFFAALLPTSSIFPFAEVLNDHRVFFPYIGLCLASAWTLRMLWVKYQESTWVRPSFLVFITLFLGLHSFGAHQRCKVWSSAESLWLDVTIKSPNNARGLMNYANALMAKADYANAEVYFEKAKALWPQYSYVYINLGVLKNATGHPDQAEANFKTAISFNPNNPECYAYYGSFLLSKGRFGDASGIAKQGLSVSPGHVGLNNLLASINSLPQGVATTKLDVALNAAKQNPSPEAWLNVSLEYYNVGDYKGCVKAAEESLKLNPKYDLAYNNICSAYNMLKEWDKAIEAGKKAVALNPTSQLNKNNLLVAQNGKAGF